MCWRSLETLVHQEYISYAFGQEQGNECGLQAGGPQLDGETGGGIPLITTVAEENAPPLHEGKHVISPPHPLSTSEGASRAWWRIRIRNH